MNDDVLFYTFDSNNPQESYDSRLKPAAEFPTNRSISIHESPATLDSLFINLRLLYIVFQSTRVLRLSTMPLLCITAAVMDFNPRESCDSRLAIGYLLITNWDISIHESLETLDKALNDTDAKLYKISIHESPATLDHG